MTRMRISAYIDQQEYMEMRQALAARRISFSGWLRDIIQRELVYLGDDTARSRLTTYHRQVTGQLYEDTYNTFMLEIEHQ